MIGWWEKMVTYYSVTLVQCVTTLFCCCSAVVLCMFCIFQQLKKKTPGPKQCLHSHLDGSLQGRKAVAVSTANFSPNLHTIASCLCNVIPTI